MRNKQCSKYTTSVCFGSVVWPQSKHDKWGLPRIAQNGNLEEYKDVTDHWVAGQLFIQSLGTLRFRDGGAFCPRNPSYVCVGGVDTTYVRVAGVDDAYASA